MPSKEQPCIVGNQTPRQTSPGRAREGRSPLAPRPRGSVGEQRAPRPHRRKQRPQENSPHRREPKSTPEQPPGERERIATLSHPVTRGGVGERSAPRPRCRKQNPSKTACIVGSFNFRQNSPGRAREGRNPLAPRHPRGCRGAERPTPAPSETKAIKSTACFVGNQNLHQSSPGRAREGVNPLDFQSIPATCAAGSR